MPFERIKVIARTLRFRLMIWNAAVVLVTAVVVLLGLREGVRFTILNEMDQILVEDLYEIDYQLSDLGTTISELRDAAREHPSPETSLLLKDLNRKARGHNQHGWFVQMVDENGQELWSSENTPLDLPIAKNEVAFHPVSLLGYRVIQNEEISQGISRPRVRVGASLAFLLKDMTRIDRLVGVATGVVLVVAPLLGYWLAGRATRPLSDIIRTTSRLRPAQLKERLHLRGTGDELDQLARTTNGFLNRMAEYLQEHRDFLANSAHELRTPIAAIRSSVEVTLGSDRTKEEYEELFLEVIDECSFLEVLVNQLLLLAETEVDRLRTHGEFVNFSQVVEKASEMFSAVAESRAIDLRMRIQPAVIVEGHLHHLRQVLNNLLDNAIKFTSPGKTIDVELHSDESDQAVLVVRDTGTGIPPEDLPHIFERFFRGDKAHSRGSETRGAGLGLSICHAVLSAHGGTISATSRNGSGTTFTIRLPRKQMESITPPFDSDNQSALSSSSAESS